MKLSPVLEIEKGPYLYNLQFPSSRIALCQVWLKLAQWFWKKILFSLVKGGDPSFEQT